MNLPTTQHDTKFAGHRPIVQQMSDSILKRYQERLEQHVNEQVVILEYTERVHHGLKGLVKLAKRDSVKYEELAECFAYGYLDTTVFPGEPKPSHIQIKDMEMLQTEIINAACSIHGLLSRNASIDENAPELSNPRPPNNNWTPISEITPCRRVIRKRCAANPGSETLSPVQRYQFKMLVKKQQKQFDAEKRSDDSKNLGSRTPSPAVCGVPPLSGNHGKLLSRRQSTCDYVPSLTAHDGWKCQDPAVFVHFFIAMVYETLKKYDARVYIPAIVYATVDSTNLSFMMTRPEPNIQGALAAALKIDPFQADNVKGLQRAVFTYIEQFKVGDMVHYRQNVYSFAFVQADAIKAQITEIRRERVMETGDVELRLFISRVQENGCLDNNQMEVLFSEVEIIQSKRTSLV